MYVFVLVARSGDVARAKPSYSSGTLSSLLGLEQPYEVAVGLYSGFVELSDVVFANLSHVLISEAVGSVKILEASFDRR
jgi:hypothetical protein